MHMGVRNSSASNKKRYIIDFNWSLNDQVEQGDFRELKSKILRRSKRQLISSDTQTIKLASASKISSKYFSYFQNGHMVQNLLFL